MTEEQVREIVREEIAREKREAAAEFYKTAVKQFGVVAEEFSSVLKSEGRVLDK